MEGFENFEFFGHDLLLGVELLCGLGKVLGGEGLVLEFGGDEEGGGGDALHVFQGDVVGEG